MLNNSNISPSFDTMVKRVISRDAFNPTDPNKLFLVKPIDSLLNLSRKFT